MGLNEPKTKGDPCGKISLADRSNRAPCYIVNRPDVPIGCCLWYNASVGTALEVSIDHDNPNTLSSQVVESVKRQIVSGRLKPGDVLPSVRELAAALKVSVRVTHEAYRALAEQGFVVVRPRLGCRVAAAGSARNRGTVLFVCSDAVSTSYYFCVFRNELRLRLEKLGCVYSEVIIYGKTSGRVALEPLKRELKKPVELVLFFDDRTDAMELVSSARVPFVSFGLFPRTYPLCRGFIRFDVAAGLGAFVAEVKRRRVKTVVQIGSGTAIDAVPALKRNGVAAEYWAFEPKGGETAQESFALSAMNLVLKRFAGGKRVFPQVLLVTDDYAAQGVLMALALLGVRVPEDLPVVAFLNRGNACAYPKRLTCLEMDPKADAVTVAAYLGDYFNGKPIPHDAAVRSVYRPGKTF